MFIQTEATPNPRTLKFLPGKPVLQNATATFTDKEMAQQSPLAEKLFGLPNITGVFYGADFITVTHDGTVHWDVLKPSVLTTIMEHYISGQPLLRDVSTSGMVNNASSSADDDPLVIQIKELIDTRVRPAVAEDGGDIVFKGFDAGVVYLEMRGACSGCPSSTATLKDGIENMLRHYIPEVERVESVAGVY